MSRFNFTENTDRVSPRLSDAPRSWLSSNSVCASCRAAAMEKRNVASFAAGSLTAMSSKPAAGASPRSTFRSLENFRPHDRVNLHFFEFFRGQPARFGNDVLRDRQFANIVQQRGCVQCLHFWRANLQFFGDLDGVHPNSLQMIVSGVIFGLNRQGQRFDGSQVEVGHLLYVPLLVFEFAQIEPVGAID